MGENDWTAWRERRDMNPLDQAVGRLTVKRKIAHPTNEILIVIIAPWAPAAVRSARRGPTRKLPAGARANWPSIQIAWRMVPIVVTVASRPCPVDQRALDPMYLLSGLTRLANSRFALRGVAK